MNVRGSQTATKRRSKDQANIRSAKPKVPKVEWQLADDELDDALRQTFPASDALSVVQSARCTTTYSGKAALNLRPQRC